jgi:hypothetical protein
MLLPCWRSIFRCSCSFVYACTSNQEPRSCRAPIVRRGPIAVKRAGLRHTCVVYDAHTGPDLAGFAGRVSDLGEGRWTITAAIDAAVPTPVLNAAPFDRFNSGGEAEFADRLLSAMRHEFGGHGERRAPEQGAP